MFGSMVLDVAVGLVFVFLLLSLICSAANELLELVLRKRARNLEKGISELIGDPDNTKDFLKAIYENGLVNALYAGRYEPGSRSLPSYIPSRNFALALLEVTDQAPVMPANIRTALAAFEKTADGDARKLRASVEDWYNGAMDRVSGWYKRRTQYFILVMGLAVAVAVNADCIEIAQRLSSDASLRQGVVAMAEAAAKQPQPTDDKNKPVDLIKENIRTLDALGLPIGWPPARDENVSFADRAGYALVHHWLGWLLTALAVSLGTPFWFDMLNKIMVVRSTVKPQEKSREEGSKDAAK